MIGSGSILVLSSCTSRKVSTGEEQTVPAESLYTGQQHIRLMRGVTAYRLAGQPAGPLDLHILSAAHGVIAADAPIRTYDATFSGMSRSQLRGLSARLGIPKDVARLLSRPRGLAVVLLGENYLQAAALETALALGGPTVIFLSPGAARQLPPVPGLYPIALDNRDTTRFSCGLTAIKGELTARLLVRLTEDPTESIPLDRAGLLGWLETAGPSRSAEDSTPVMSRAA